jgi:hypothetical protein
MVRVVESGSWDASVWALRHAARALLKRADGAVASGIDGAWYFGFIMVVLVFELRNSLSLAWARAKSIALTRSASWSST